MSGEATSEGTAAQGTAPGPLGVLATFRATSTAAKALLAGVFVSRLAGFLALFLVLYLTHRGFTPAKAGLALGLYGGGSVLGTLLGGWLSDRLSARTATLISMVGSAGLIVAVIYIPWYPLILLDVLLVSTVAVLFRPAAQTLLTELTPPGQLVMVTAMYRLCLNLGTAAAPVLGVALVVISYNLLFWAEGMAALIYGLIALRYLPRRAKPAPGTAPAAAGEAPSAKPSSGYLAVLADWRYVFFLVAILLVSMVYVQYTASLPLAIKHAGLSLWWYGAVVTLNAVIVAVCEVPATKYVQHWPLRLTALGGFGLIAIGYAVYAIKMIPVFIVIGTLIWTANEIIGAPTSFAYPGLVAPAHLRGRYFGAMQSVFGLGLAIGPIVGVWLWYHVHQAAWLWAVGVALASTVCARIGMRRISEEPAPQPVAEPVGEPAA